MTHSYGSRSGNVTELASKYVPSAIPKLMGTAGNTVRDDEYVNRSYNVFHLGEGPSNIPAEVGTLSVPLRDDKYLEAVPVMKRVIADLKAQKGWEFPGLISLRFVKGTDILLADKEDVCKFEIILTGESTFIQKQAQTYMDAFFEALDKRFPGDVRAHFGHTGPQSAERPEGRRQTARAVPRRPRNRGLPLRPLHRSTRATGPTRHIRDPRQRRTTPRHPRARQPRPESRGLVHVTMLVPD